MDIDLDYAYEHYGQWKPDLGFQPRAVEIPVELAQGLKRLAYGYNEAYTAALNEGLIVTVKEDDWCLDFKIQLEGS